jgi:hypothetical protein
MKIAFIHYHLKTGGVTTVLRQQVEAIRDHCRCLVIAGSHPDADFPVKTVVIPELGYTRPDQKPFDPAGIADSIIRTIYSAFDGDCDVLHVHNPTLAKNKHFLQILAQLKRRNVNLFLQIHDFAEDGRPLVYYPDAYISNCHYGVLNSRDYAILLKAGLKSEGLHIIPNMVNPVRGMRQDTPPGDFVLYPIRAIRRKNIGEAILLTLFFDHGEKLVITLPPNSPVDMISYRDWKSFVKKHNLAVEFDAGIKKDFRGLVQAAKFLITTSITEGFGFSFLEPWVYDKLLWGRRLSNISQDFEENGIRLDHLYDRIMVPVDWIDSTKFFKRWISCIQHTCDVFNYPIQKDHITTAFERISANDRVDFGLLDEGFQKQIIMRVLVGKKNADILKQMNTFLIHPGKVPQKDTLIRENKRAALKNYDRHSYRKKLMEIYTSVSQQTVHQRIDKNVLLSEFLKLDEFSLLKWCNHLE